MFRYAIVESRESPTCHRFRYDGIHVQFRPAHQPVFARHMRKGSRGWDACNILEDENSRAAWFTYNIAAAMFRLGQGRSWNCSNRHKRKYKSNGIPKVSSEIYNLSGRTNPQQINQPYYNSCNTRMKTTKNVHGTV